MSRRAIVLLKDRPDYRRDAFVAGIETHGYRVADKTVTDPGPDDMLICWNRYGAARDAANLFEQVGATVVVAENGVVGNDDQGRKLYQVALGYHNGAGRWFVGTEDRWSRLEIRCKPWRQRGEKVLILPQRIAGTDGVAMPKEAKAWADETALAVRKVTDRPVEIREHPGNINPKPVPDWRDVHAAVVWGSSAGVKAIIAGVPVFHLMPEWIGKTAAKFGVEEIEDPWMGDRQPMLHCLGWMQWTVEEIARGEPFGPLLAMREREAA